jgi:universal stress protein F
MFGSILIAVDLNAMDGAGRLARAARCIASEGAALHVVNVVPEAGMAMVGAALGPDHSKTVLREAFGALERWASEALGPGATAHVTQGTIYDAVLRRATEIGAEAIIVGAHRPELRDYLVGPNAARIVRHASQSVFVIR